MKNLFIIGNGFDQRYGLKTSYEKFHKYIQEEYPGADAEKIVQSEVYTMPDDGEAFEDADVVIS